MLDRAKSARLTQALAKFCETPLDAGLEHARESIPAVAALDLFHRVATTVPAYRRFLQEHGVDAAGVLTPEDFAALPFITKQNYVLRYPLADLCRDGRLESCDMVAVSSGSTGVPTFWPRSLADEMATAARFEQVFHDSFCADTRRTLAIVCFALGTWVGGLFTTACCRHLAAKGYAITVATPGSSKAEIWRILRELAPQFEQTVLLGYPPFLKDVIDSGTAEGIDWTQLRPKLVMAGEVFSEAWRDLVGARFGSDDPCFDSAALYGTADAGVLANETPLSIRVRRFLSETPDAARQLFGQSRLPTLAQYDPYARYFESMDGTLLFSGDNGVPLIRYNIADSGGLLGYEPMLRFLKDWQFDPLPDFAGKGWRGVRRLPFVYVFGRSDFTVSYFGANIYPENISVALEQPEIAAWVTGKFVLEAREGLGEPAHLAIDVELAPGVAPFGDEIGQRCERIAETVVAQLLRLNSEFANYTPAAYRQPRIALYPAGDPDHFPPGIKHRYARR